MVAGSVVEMGFCMFSRFRSTGVQEENGLNERRTNAGMYVLLHGRNAKLNYLILTISLQDKVESKDGSLTNGPRNSCPSTAGSVNASAKRKGAGSRRAWRTEYFTR